MKTFKADEGVFCKAENSDRMYIVLEERLNLSYGKLRVRGVVEKKRQWEKGPLFLQDPTLQLPRGKRKQTPSHKDITILENWFDAVRTLGSLFIKIGERSWKKTSLFRSYSTSTGVIGGYLIQRE